MTASCAAGAWSSPASATGCSLFLLRLLPHGVLLPLMEWRHARRGAGRSGRFRIAADLPVLNLRAERDTKSYGRFQFRLSCDSRS